VTIRAAILFVALACAAGAQDLPPARARVADAARADLAKLTELERAYFAKNKRYSADLAALKFTGASGARIAVSYASARTFSASAQDIRFAPFICFVIASSPAADPRTGDSPAEKPFCADSRFGTAAAALAEAGSASDAPRLAEEAPDRVAITPPSGVSPSAPTVTSVTPALPAPLRVFNEDEFAQRLQQEVAAPGDSAIVIVQFAVKDARYDPSRGILEIALPSVALPVIRPFPGDSAVVRPALTCFVRPAFVCGSGTLSYIARDLWHVTPKKALDAETMRSGLSLRATFALGRRDASASPSLTLLALVLQAKGNVVSRWELPAPH
jgi:hypothetical protein